MNLIKRLFSSDIKCPKCEKHKNLSPLRGLEPETLTAGYVDGRIRYCLRSDKEGPWSSLDLFGEEKWSYIKSGIIKLYGLNRSDWDYYTRIMHHGYSRYLKEIPLSDIPGIDNNSKLSWNYSDPYELCADIWKEHSEKYIVDEKGPRIEIQKKHKLWNCVNVITPVKVMSEMIMREREKRKEQEETLRKKREKFLIDSKDDTICDLLKKME